MNVFAKWFDESARENQSITTNEKTFQESFEKLKNRNTPNLPMRNNSHMKWKQKEFARSRLNFHAHSCPHCEEMWFEKRPPNQNECEQCFYRRNNAKIIGLRECSIKNNMDPRIIEIINLFKLPKLNDIKGLLFFKSL